MLRSARSQANTSSMVNGFVNTTGYYSVLIRLI